MGELEKARRNLAIMYLSLGEKHEGPVFLRRALKERSCTLLEINTEPLLLALEGDPEFEAIRAEFRLPNSAELGTNAVASNISPAQGSQARGRSEPHRR